jgi:hypothetical protein
VVEVLAGVVDEDREEQDEWVLREEERQREKVSSEVVVGGPVEESDGVEEVGAGESILDAILLSALSEIASEEVVLSKQQVAEAEGESDQAEVEIGDVDEALANQGDFERMATGGI